VKLELALDGNFRVDWRLLAIQKRLLVDVARCKRGDFMEITAAMRKKADGLLSFLDAFQDAAARELGERRVFPHLRRSHHVKK
jgi:hypothetical protein